MNTDLHNNLKLRVAKSYTAVTDNTAIVSNIIDTQGYDALEFAIQAHTLADADATFAVTIDHGDASNLSDAAAVSSVDLLGTTADASFTFAADDSVKKIGYTGIKRYVRVTVTPSANAASAGVSMLAILGAPGAGASGPLT